ncbi:hypothetical protein [Streptomyces sp. NBC_00237]|nr:hypothetical protein [Streptomyces sp. NBC_00237]
MTQIRQILDQIPEVMDAWRRAIDSLRRRRPDEADPADDDNDETRASVS